MNRGSRAVVLRRSPIAGLAIAALLILAAAHAAHASLPPRNAPECDGLRADAPCINGADNKKGVCAHGPVDSAGRAALFCKVDDKVDGKDAAAASPASASTDKSAARSGCSVAHGLATQAWSDVLLGAFLCLAITVFVTRRFRRH